MTNQEIFKAINKLKNGKASGLDLMLNEMLNAGQKTLIGCLNKLFNLIFTHSTYPKQWINSCVGKLFNIVLNTRLVDHFTKRDILTDCQVGFRSKSRTTDHMCILKCLVDKYTNSKGNKLYACFVDFKRAFDTVIHPGMRIKMLKSDIGGNFYHLIKHMYTLNKLRVKVDNKLGQCFNSHIGVMQWDVLSPSLFNLFIHDLPNCLQNCSESVSLCTGRIDCLLYADDVIIFFNSE